MFSKYRIVFGLFLILGVLLMPVHNCLAQLSRGPFQEKTTSVSNIRMTLNNSGLIGNAFRNSYFLGFPSCESPVFSGIEHLFQGGLWVGGIKNGTEFVTTGAFDASQGYVPGSSDFEFTWSGPISERSNRVNAGPLYKQNSVSPQDFLTTFTDTVLRPRAGGTAIPGHVPLGLSVKMESYNFDDAYSNFFVALSYNIKNISSTPIDSVWLGYWADPVIRNVNITSPGGTAFFSQSGTGYIDSLNTAYEFDSNGDVQFTRSYFGLTYLGATDKLGYRSNITKCNLPINNRFLVNFNTWQFNSPTAQLFPPQVDFAKYQRMKAGLNAQNNWPALQDIINKPSNRSVLVSAGPFASLQPGDSVTIYFAAVIGKMFEDGNPPSANTPLQRKNLISNIKLVQTAFEGNDKNCDGKNDQDSTLPVKRFLLPTPPDIPFTKVVPRDNFIDIYWANNAEASIDPISNLKDFEGYKVYATGFAYDTRQIIELDSAIKLVKQYDVIGDTISFETGFNSIKLPKAIKFEGDTISYVYKYTYGPVQNGWQTAISLTSFDKGDVKTGLLPRESSLRANLAYAFPGKTANTDAQVNAPYVYPNPYYGEAAWEGIASKKPDTKKVIFANLPAKCRIRIFTSSGDLVQTLDHNQEYTGADAKWFNAFSDTSRTVFSGGEHVWNLLSSNSQIISRGLYLFSVEDIDTKKYYQGKFAIIK